MINFCKLKIVKHRTDNFVGIRKSKSENCFEFCLPYGFTDFPEEDFNQVRDLFFKMYRTFRKFERDNQATNRFQINKPEYQRDQDQTTLSSRGISIQINDGEPCLLYSKLRMIERILEAYDDLAINSIQKKVIHSEQLDYSQLYRYLNRAIYLDNDVIYVDAMDFPRPIMCYDSTDLINLYCYILNEIVQQLDGDVSDNIQAHTQNISCLAQGFKDDYLTSNQSIFDKDTSVETMNILKEALDKIDKSTYYKDSDYWVIYEAIETFLYSELNPDHNNGEFWGVQGFSLVWEDMCHTYFFKNYNDAICFADADILLKDRQNKARQGQAHNRVGNFEYQVNDENNYGNQWIYQTESHICHPKPEEGFLGWNELLCIEFDTQPKTLVYSHISKNHFEHDRRKAKRRFLRPDLVLKLKSDLEQDFELRIIDYKDVPIDFYYKNLSLPSGTEDEKYKLDVIKQLTYELALQQTPNVKVSINCFLIPYYYQENSNSQEFEEDQLTIKGIKIIKFNFALIQKVYLDENS